MLRVQCGHKMHKKNAFSLWDMSRRFEIGGEGGSLDWGEVKAKKYMRWKVVISMIFCKLVQQKITKLTHNNAIRYKYVWDEIRIWVKIIYCPSCIHSEFHPIFIAAHSMACGNNIRKFSHLGGELGITPAANEIQVIHSYDHGLERLPIPLRRCIKSSMHSYICRCIFTVDIFSALAR